MYTESLFMIDENTEIVSEPREMPPFPNEYNPGEAKGNG